MSLTRNQIKTVVFDAYGTLFDVYSVYQVGETLFPSHGQALSVLWRDKQIEYTRLRTLSNRYADFLAITGDALDFACARLNLPLSSEGRASLMEAYTCLVPFTEVRDVLRSMKSKTPMAILSNGTPAMLQALIHNAGLGDTFAAVLSVDTVAKFKTAPETYRLASDTFDCAPSSVLFVSCNGWDVCGAAWFGFKTYWVNRHGLPFERLGVVPDFQHSDLTGLLDVLADS